ncbi:TMEM165/GDT1 family protein [Aerosakkonemataceae cyanobacterium BLCC-F154]|uniref:GDT1 family protein n=1 Tax=Floridaenema fluviatile BLCC-F154 TaxID=3153640 RepID=A0ABV4Y812_9CYAN
MLTAFTAGLLLITVSELGDKTFFIAAILAMRHSRRLIFIGVTAALAAMTILSVLVGQAVSLLPKIYVYYAEIILFVGFGLKLLYEASKMSDKSESEEAEEALEEVNKAEAKIRHKQSNLAIVTKAFVMTFVAEWGDRTQFATISLAAGYNAFGITTGAILGHGICAAIAVTCGKLIAKRISERSLTAIGGILFLLFALVSYLEGV